MYQKDSTSNLCVSKTPEKLLKCWVHWNFCGIEDKTAIKIQESTTVADLVNETLAIIKLRNNDAIKPNHTYNLFASKRNGTKKQDLPAFLKGQKISLTGVKSYFLDLREQSSYQKSDEKVSVSTRIQSDFTFSTAQEITPKKQYGCFCFK